jgi:hypothetical protein
MAMRNVFISHAFSADAGPNARRVLTIARACAKRGVLPLAPQIYLPRFIDEATERELALKMCLTMVALCDEVRIYGEISAGMLLEIAEAQRLGIPVVEGETGKPLFAKREPPRRKHARAAVVR